MKVKYNAHFAFRYLFVVSIAQESQCRTVDAGGWFDNEWHVALFGIFIKIIQAFTNTKFCFFFIFISIFNQLPTHSSPDAQFIVIIEFIE